VGITAGVFWAVRVCNLAHGYLNMERVYLSETLAQLIVYILRDRSLTGYIAASS